jgi:hypothetical protein
MSKNGRLPATSPRKAKGRRGLKHGVAAYLKTGAIPSGRAFRRVQKEITQIREDLFGSPKYGGPGKISPDVRAILEGAIGGLTVEKLCTLYVKRAGILRLDSLAVGNLALHDVLGRHYVAFANLVRLNLEAAARLAAQGQGKQDEVMLADIIKEYREEAKETAVDGPGLMQDGRSPDGEGQDMGEGQGGRA